MTEQEIKYYKENAGFFVEDKMESLDEKFNGWKETVEVSMTKEQVTQYLAPRILEIIGEAVQLGYNDADLALVASQFHYYKTEIVKDNVLS